MKRVILNGTSRDFEGLQVTSRDCKRLRETSRDSRDFNRLQGIARRLLWTSRDFVTVQLTSQSSWDFKRSHWFRWISYDFRREVSVVSPLKYAFNIVTLVQMNNIKMGTWVWIAILLLFMYSVEEEVHLQFYNMREHVFHFNNMNKHIDSTLIFSLCLLVVFSSYFNLDSHLHLNWI